MLVDGTEEDDEADEEAIIDGQETQNVEDQVQIKFSQQNEESGKEDQEEKRREATRRLQDRDRRSRLK
jgi:hypothetical protein